MKDIAVAQSASGQDGTFHHLTLVVEYSYVYFSITT